MVSFCNEHPTEATVFMDGKELGTTPYFDDQISPGKNHSITVSAEGFIPATKSLEIKVDTQELHFELQPRIE